jgi:hypothetical protein
MGIQRCRHFRRESSSTHQVDHLGASAFDAAGYLQSAAAFYHRKHVLYPRQICCCLRSKGFGWPTVTDVHLAMEVIDL